MSDAFELDAGTPSGGETGAGNPSAIAAATAAVERAAEPAGPAVVRIERRGRHKKECVCPICRQRRGETTSKHSPTDSPATLPVVNPPIDADAVKRCVLALAKSGDKWLRARIERRATKLSDAATAAELAAAAGLEPEDAELLADLAGQVAAKHALLGAHAPEILLSLAIVAHGIRVQAVLAKLTELEKLSKAPAPIGPPVADAT
jgi:hypothetical protein